MVFCLGRFLLQVGPLIHVTTRIRFRLVDDFYLGSIGALQPAFKLHFQYCIFSGGIVGLDIILDRYVRKKCELS